MGLSTGEITDESCQGNPSSDYSVNAKVSLKDNAHDDVQITSSLTNDSTGVEPHPNVSSGTTALLNHTPVETDFKNDDQGDLTNSKYGDRCPNGGTSGNICRNTLPSNSVSATTREPVITRSSKDQSGGLSSLELMDTCSDHPNGNSFSGTPDMKNSVKHFGSHSEDGASDMVSAKRCASGGGADNDGCNSAALDKEFRNGEAETSTGAGTGNISSEALDNGQKIEAGSSNRSSEALDNGEKIEQKVDELRELPEVQETSMTSQCVDDSDESDFVEEDVKVCDICGDAGREDLLAICSRCTDGAEHTYCMREMVSKVPEGDWLCEECKEEDEINKMKPDKVIVDRNYKRQSSGLSNSSDSVKLDKKDLDGDRKFSNKDSSSSKASSKRLAESADVSAAKRQALESSIGSPKTSSPSRVPALSRDSSFRSLDKGKVKPAHQLSSGSVSINNTSQDAFHLTNQRLRKAQGSLMKSSSFNATLAKPQVEPDDIDPKKKSAREPASLGSKEVGIRSIGKSMSFKSGNPSRFNVPESKVKMLSPNYPHGQDLKLSKSSKERNLLERRSSFKSNRSVMGSATGSSTISALKNDKKVASYGENGALPSASNNREFKGSQFDSKLNTSKSAGYVPRKSSELQASLGENKRQSCPAFGIGTSLTNGISSSSAQSHTNLKNDLSSSTGAVEKQFNNVNESIRDVLPRPWGAALGERTREGSINRSRPPLITTGERSGPCQKCNEFGHSAEFCSVSSPASLLDAAKSPREVINKGNDLKAAIEAAMLKKPGIYRKSKISGQSNDSTLSNVNLNGEIRSQDQSLTPRNSSNMLPEVHDGQAGLRNFATDSFKQTKAGGLTALVSPDEKPSRSDFPGHALAAVSFLKISSIPDHEHVWQGIFEVSKREIRELHVGIQAHLSSTSSPKVLEEVTKFPTKINFIEVPRLSTWPMQFKETGAKEDNIALYFFAKDLESYERSYKVLVETMIRSDLALKGNFGGLELLIFPSSHLPDKSQRWNMLYFLWGVFRGKKVNCSQNVAGSPRENLFGRDVPSAASLSDKTPLSEPKDLAQSKACNIAASSECPPFTESLRAVCDAKAGLRDPKDQHLHKNLVVPDCRPDVNALPTTERGEIESFQERSSSRNSMDINVDPLSKMDIDPQPYVEASRTSIEASQKTVSTAAVHPDKSPHNQTTMPFSFDHSHGRVDTAKAFKEQDESLETKSSLQRGHQSLGDLNCLPRDISEPVSQASAISCTSRNETSRVSPYGGECASTDQGTVFTPVFDAGPSSQMKDTGGMFFFKVDPQPVKDLRPTEVVEVAPNLELALGAETRPSRGILPFLEGGTMDLREAWSQQPLENVAKEEEDDASASLSLSLSFPSSEAEQIAKSAPKAPAGMLFFNNSSSER